MKMKDTGKILHNRYVLYFVLFLALSDLLFLAMGSEFISVAVFILSGFVTTFFSRNMMVVMCVAMVVTNILKYGTDIRMQEGLKAGAATDTEVKPEVADAEAAAVKAAAVKAPAVKTAATEAADVKVPAVKAAATEAAAETKVTAAAVITPAQVEKLKENMEKLESYEPLFTSMDKMMEKINELISP
jgi:hypothetical protein